MQDVPLCPKLAKIWCFDRKRIPAAIESLHVVNHVWVTFNTVYAEAVVADGTMCFHPAAVCTPYEPDP